jgi:hypothetical protein
LFTVSLVEPGHEALSFLSFPLRQKAGATAGSSVVASQVISPSARGTKRGFKDFSSPLTCGVSFQGPPVWLWTLRPRAWKTIFILKRDWEVLQLHHLPLWESFGGSLVVVDPPLNRSISCHEASVWWISGSMQFIDTLSLPAEVPQIYWVATTGRWWPKSDNGVLWKCISHSHVGGSTNAAERLDGVSSLQVWIYPRNISDVSHMLSSSQSVPILNPCAPDINLAHYTLADRLSLSFLDKPVLFPTYMSLTGWGLRSLEASELSACFDLPSSMPWDPLFVSTIVPFQLYWSIIDFVVSSLVRTSPGPSKCRRMVESRNIDSVEDGVWLPGVGARLSGSWALVNISDKAVKADDAQVDTQPWHKRVSLVLPCLPGTLEVVERFLMRRWRRCTVVSFFSYLREAYGDGWASLLSPVASQQAVSAVCESKKRPFKVAFSPPIARGGGYSFSSSRERELRLDVVKGLAVLGQVLRSTWWDWTNGSSLLFWRWNGSEQIRAARDGMAIHVLSSLPRAKRGKGIRFDPAVKALVAVKVQIMIDRSYLEPGSVSSFLNYFAVPKGESDIRVVYDGTLSGLNGSLWCPNFFLPSARHAGELLNYSSWMADMDFGEFFHNFHMDEKIQRHSGVDLVSLNLPKQGGVEAKLRWSRLFMGMCPSPYNAVRHY